MPLLWGIVAASVAFAWLRPLDLAGVVLAAVAGRWTAHRLCNLRWRNGSVERENYISVLRGRKVTLEFRNWSR